MDKLWVLRVSQLNCWMHLFLFVSFSYVNVLFFPDVEKLHASHPYLFPEFELLTEPEEYEEQKEKSEAQKMKEYEEFLSKDETKEQLFDKEAAKDLDGMAKEEKLDDIIFSNFKERIKHEPDQVQRTVEFLCYITVKPKNAVTPTQKGDVAN